MREVRQRCGFGCVICGLPLYEYDHITGWANTHEHDVRDIMLLCDRHHREKTNGLLPMEAVNAANENPRNLRAGLTEPYTLHYSGDRFKIDIGSNVFQGADQGGGTSVDILRIDGHPLIAVTLEDGHYLLDLNVYDNNNAPILQIEQNELVANARSWDIEFVGTQLIIREGPGKILFDISFLPPSEIQMNRGRLLYNDVELLITPGFLLVLNNRLLLQRNTARGSYYAGIVLGEDPDRTPASFRFNGIRREGWNRQEAISWAYENVAKTARVKAITEDLLSVDLREAGA